MNCVTQVSWVCVPIFRPKTESTRVFFCDGKKQESNKSSGLLRPPRNRHSTLRPFVSVSANEIEIKQKTFFSAT